MNKCRNCGFENVEEMNFCGECGAPVKNAPQIVVPLEDIESQERDDKTVQSFGADIEAETLAGNRYQPLSPTLSTQKSQSNKLIFAVFGGLLALFFLVFVGGAALAFFYWKSHSQNVQIKPTSVPVINSKKNPTIEEPGENPVEMPQEEPEDNPENPSEDNPQITFAPPTKPTQSGSFNIDANVRGWQLSDINIVDPEIFSVIARGKISLHGIQDDVSASGVEDNQARRIYKKFPTGALLMRTNYGNGKFSSIQPIATPNLWNTDPQEIGKLEFLVNDNAPENNDNGFDISVEMRSDPK